MSHFTVMVIGNNPEKQLKPFDESIEVKEYIREKVSEAEIKRCVDYYVKEKGFVYSNNFAELYKKYGNDWNGGVWRPQSDGTWNEYSTYNPKSKWDWYSLGGRWSGLIKLKNGTNGKTGKASLVMGNETGIDQAKKKDIANFDEISTFAILKDGKWYERGEMGWWGMVHKEKDEKKWEKEFKKLIGGLPDDTLISIYDCHI